VLHLQCHIGRDTLCLARRGAIVTGLDFSPAAIKIARRLAEETGLNATFIEGRVDETSQLAPGPFDLVFATWGTLCWLPDLRDWARVIDCVLAPGGELYCADAHPDFVVLEEHAGHLVPTFDFQTPSDRPLDRRRRADDLHGRSDLDDASSDEDMAPFVVRSFRCTHGCRPDDHDVSRA
jgi:SAM-dependent methyltransferase